MAGSGFYFGLKPFREETMFRKECPVLQTEKRIVKGDSLAPILNPGDEVKILFNYYECYDIEPNDIVAYHFAGQPDEPIIKIIKAVPGDSFKLQKTGSIWQIFVNDKILKNSQGMPYTLPEPKQKMLALYQGALKENTYLILGNLPEGSLDSARFGLIHKSDVLGKVEQE